MRRFGVCVLVAITSCLPEFALVDGGSLEGSAGDAGALDVVEASAPDAPQLASPDVIFGSNLVLWLDADDSSTITFNSAGTVASWSDRSTHHNDAKTVLSNDAGPSTSLKLTKRA